MHAYNLFRSKGAEPMFCAVPEQRSVPSFVTDRRWEFSGRIDDERDGPFGFDRRAAASGVRFNGFHLFPDFQQERT